MAQRHDTPHSSGPAPVRVVLVDDYGPLRRVLAQVLEAHGCVTVGEASDGLQAMDVVAAVHPDVVVMDVQMPVMDGLEATRRLCQRDPETHVVVFSFVSDPALHDALRSAGARQHFDKEDIDGLAAYVSALKS